MPGTGWSPRIVPYGADQTVYLVIDRFRDLATGLPEFKSSELISKPSSLI